MEENLVLLSLKLEVNSRNIIGNLKTLTLVLDDRFIAKELSRAELETMETFGPAYFDYMSSAFTAEVR